MQGTQRIPRPEADLKRSTLSRLTSVWLALVLLFGRAEDAFGQHACEHHDFPRAGAVVAEGHAAGAAGAHADPSTDGEEHGAPCTCLGACQAGGAGAPLPAPGGELRVLVLDAAPALVPGRDEPSRLRSIPFLLPYGQAPPAGC